MTKQKGRSYAQTKTSPKPRYSRTEKQISMEISITDLPTFPLCVSILISVISTTFPSFSF